MPTEPPPLKTPDILEIDTGRPSEFEMTQSIRRQDLRDLGTTFSAALKPLTQVLARMKDLNTVLNKSAAQSLRFNLYQLAVIALSILTLCVLAAGYFSLRGSYKVLVQHTDTLRALEGQVEGQAKLLKQLRETARSTETTVAAVKKEQDTAPQLSLIPETDPVKARRAPVRLLVRPSRRDPPQGSEPLNIPLSPEAF